MPIRNLLNNEESIPSIEDLLPEPMVPDDFMAWPYIDNLFDFTKIIGKKKN